MKGKWLLLLQDEKGCLEEIRDKSLYILLCSSKLVRNKKRISLEERR